MWATYIEGEPQRAASMRPLYDSGVLAVAAAASIDITLDPGDVRGTCSSRHARPRRPVDRVSTRVRCGSTTTPATRELLLQRLRGNGAAAVRRRDARATLGIAAG
jgi:hypothetical protein